METPLGPMVAGATAQGLCLLEFGSEHEVEEQAGRVQQLFGAPPVEGPNPHLETLQEELARYFAGQLREFSLPLVYSGTPFQRQVWDQLRRIPYGETRSYEDIAIAVRNPKAVRAVGRANGLNPIAIVIPCHRVVNKSGRLGGYGGGLGRKEYLLRLERSTLS
ncbi:cysteine methyltransferase [Limnochorda pilosa]|uniref:Methylated-DNA--protein-cysteine methyltransferase n=1 Tax=Limnochorda pilosa TaxID=1555112 RepID=A0A0K2SGN4_LIMPI|nr:cysteine methyltransferase [Limnochorda pilosa]